METNPVATTFPEADLDDELLQSVEQPVPEAAASPLAGDLALCLSGGGYRAAAFHLGVLDMLARLDLLPRLTTLSTISGGTITGAMYALSQARGDAFDDFYRQVYQALKTRNVVAEAFDGLEGPGDPDASPSLIRAAANVYAGSAFVGDARFEELLASPRGPDELIFSATEFRTGLAFRFQTSRRDDSVVGNQPDLRIPRDVARSMRVADVVAASSCFPSAFEPLRFPDDFTWEPGETLAEVRSRLGKGFAEPVPLMDGGVYDNQGVDGVLQVYRRQGRSVGLVIVSDSSPRKSPIFTYPVTKRRGGLTLGRAVWLGYALFAAALASTGLLTARLVQALGDGFQAADFFLDGFPLLLTACVAAALYWVRATFRREASRVHSQTSVDLWPVLRKLSISDAIQLVDGRVGSLVALTSSVFMKRVRGLVQRGLYVDEKYKRRVVFSLIYDLCRDRESLFSRFPWLKPTPAMAEAAEAAENVPTTLWCTSEADLQNLVAVGQMTICFKLLDYLLRERAEATRHEGSPEQRLLDQAKACWEELKLDPKRYSGSREG